MRRERLRRSALAGGAVITNPVEPGVKLMRLPPADKRFRDKSVTRRPRTEYPVRVSRPRKRGRGLVGAIMKALGF